MKNVILLLFVPVLLFSCKKTAERKAEDIIIYAMVNGQWAVTKFTKGNATLTPEFSGYKFQFKTNNTVDAIKNGAVEASGSWQGYPESRSIASHFANGSATLSFLNGTWVVTKNSWTFVEASQTVAGELYTLRLDKQ